jgi:phospholipase/carboxylesterase
MRIETIGRLKCRIIDRLPANAKPGIVVILCHGYGASGSDLVPIADELFDQFTQLEDHIAFVFPEAPQTLDHLGLPGGRAWWAIDMVKLQLADATGRFREMRSNRPDGLPEAREKLTETVTQLCQQFGLNVSQIVLGGFSQGAMLTTDTALHLEQNPAALVALSGTLLNEAEWRNLVPNHVGLRVLQSHGTQDPILPYGAAEDLRKLLIDSGAAVEFIPFAGGHQIPFEVIERFGALLEGL